MELHHDKNTKYMDISKNEQIIFAVMSDKSKIKIN